MVFSSKSDGKLVLIKNMVCRIIREEGFVINRNKTRFLGPRRRRRITGIVISDNSLGIGKFQKRILRAQIHKLENNKLGSLDKEHLDMKIKGWYSHLHSVDKVAFMQLKEYQDKLKEKYKK